MITFTIRLICCNTVKSGGVTPLQKWYQPVAIFYPVRGTYGLRIATVVNTIPPTHTHTKPLQNNAFRLNWQDRLIAEDHIGLVLKM